jgi:small subunit ribosomal protein S6
MRNYEIAYIADPDLDEASLTGLEEKVKGWVEAAGGAVLKVDRWGKRRMAYPIRKRRDGVYTFVYTNMPPQAGVSIEANMRLTEPILRFLLTSESQS